MCVVATVRHKLNKGCLLNKIYLFRGVKLCVKDRLKDITGLNFTALPPGCSYAHSICCAEPLNPISSLQSPTGSWGSQPYPSSTRNSTNGGSAGGGSGMRSSVFCSIYGAVIWNTQERILDHSKGTHNNKKWARFRLSGLKEKKMAVFFQVNSLCWVAHAFSYWEKGQREPRVRGGSIPSSNEKKSLSFGRGRVGSSSISSDCALRYGMYTSGHIRGSRVSSATREALLCVGFVFSSSTQERWTIKPFP